MALFIFCVSPLPLSLPSSSRPFFPFIAPTFSDESSLELEKLDKFLDLIYHAYAEGVKASGNSSVGEDTNWDYYSAFFFSTTVVTTIGFGNIAPR